VYEALTRLPDVDRTKDIALYALTANYKEVKAWVKKLHATERIMFNGRLAEMSDAERTLNARLREAGLGDVTNDEDRLKTAQELENEEAREGEGEEEGEEREEEEREEEEREGEGEGEEEGDGEAGGEGEGDGNFDESQVSIYSS